MVAQQQRACGTTLGVSCLDPCLPPTVEHSGIHQRWKTYRIYGRNHKFRESHLLRLPDKVEVLLALQMKSLQNGTSISCRLSVSPIPAPPTCLIDLLSVFTSLGRALNAAKDARRVRRPVGAGAVLLDPGFLWALLSI